LISAVDKEEIRAVKYQIPRNKGGVPVFPEIDMEKAPLEDTRKVLEVYFQYVWGA
jgi:hypothetical protein